MGFRALAWSPALGQEPPQDRRDARGRLSRNGRRVPAPALGVPSRCAVLKASLRALVFGLSVGNNFNSRGFGPLLGGKLCLIFKLAPTVCRMAFPILAPL